MVGEAARRRVGAAVENSRRIVDKGLGIIRKSDQSIWDALHDSVRQFRQENDRFIKG